MSIEKNIRRKIKKINDIGECQNRKKANRLHRKNKKNTVRVILPFLLAVIAASTITVINLHNDSKNTTVAEDNILINSIENIPDYDAEIYIEINGNIPYFKESELTTEAFEYYSGLDSLGRCGVAYACIGVEIMPTEERGEIGMIKPTGWHTVKYDFVDGKYLYNRCHLIAYQLSGENANEKNLITGTRYFNTQGMLPFEEKVGDYVRTTKNHVLYRVTPVFKGSNLVASGVLMEAYSVEDNGEGVCYNVFVYNIEPNIEINYSTGESKISD